MKLRSTPQSEDALMIMSLIVSSPQIENSYPNSYPPHFTWHAPEWTCIGSDGSMTVNISWKTHLQMKIQTYQIYFTTIYIGKRSKASRCEAPKSFLCQFAWLPCRFFQGRRQGRQPLNMMGKYYPSLSSKPWDVMGFQTMRKNTWRANMRWYTRTRNNQTNDGFGDLASLLKSMKVNWVHERNHRCPFPAGWFHRKVPNYWRILVLKKMVNDTPIRPLYSSKKDVHKKGPTNPLCFNR